MRTAMAMDQDQLGGAKWKADYPPAKTHED